MKKKINKWRVILMIGFGFVLIMICQIIYTMVSDQETSSKFPLTEYNNLFNKAAQDKLQILATVKSRNREPVSTYLYDNEYNICVFKVTLSKNRSLTNIIDFQNKASTKSLVPVYADLPSFNFDMSIKAGKSISVSNVHFKINGDSIKSMVKNDSVYCYYYKFKTFSINYNNEPYDIIANSDQSNIPASVIFKAKGKSLYVIIMTVANGREEMQADQLCSIIDK